MRLALLPFVCFASLSLSPAQQQDGPLVLSLSEIVLDQYVVHNVSVEDLFQLATSLGGRTYYIKERGGDGQAVDNLRMLGEAIVLYDTKAEVQRVKELLTRLDVSPQPAESSWKSLEYRPRFVSMGTAAQAADSGSVSVNQIVDRGLIVLSGEGAEVDATLELLKRIDVPEKQVFLTCQLLEVVDAPEGPALAKELADNLQKLLPQSRFAQTGIAMLKTSVGGGAPISVRIDTLDFSYRLSFTPVAFDEASGSLTVANCELVQEGPPQRELFRTNTVLRGGEYTVLGATGATPRLLVVRVVPQA